MKRILIILLSAYYSLSSTSCCAQLQGQARIDSLLQALTLQKEDTNKVTLLRYLVFDLARTDPEMGLKYGRQGMALANKLKWQKGIGLMNAQIAVNYEALSDYDKALDCSYKALQIFEQIAYDTGLAKVRISVGNVYYRKGEYNKAIKQYEDAKLRYEALGDMTYAAKLTCNIGAVYYDMGNYSKSLEQFLIALKVLEKQDDKISTGFLLGNIGGVYQEMGEYESALTYYLKDLKISQELGSKLAMAMTMGNIGNVYRIQGNYDKALEYHFSGLKVQEEVGNKRGAALALENIGTVYFSQLNYTMAIEYFYESLKLSEALGLKNNVASILGNIGYCFLTIYEQKYVNRNYVPHDNLPESAGVAYRPPASGILIPEDRATILNSAIHYLRRSVPVAEETGGLKVLQQNCKQLSEAYRMKGDYDKALQYYQQYAIIKDSVFSSENEKKIVQQQMQYDYSKREDSLKLINAKKEKDAALRFQKQRSYTYLGIGGALALAVFSFFMFRNNKLLGREKKRSDDLLLNILPAEVATELKETGGAKAKHFDNVTVLFTDFVNFTKAAEEMKPQALIDELHACFERFDAIMGKYGIEKIKTIGDAYLAVAGLPVADKQHAAHAVAAAKEMNDFMEERYGHLGRRTFEMRIGIHSGSVVAGIVGVKKFAYDIWGDTVNTAARMEQNSEAGKINISAATYEFVKDKFACEYRGEIEVKGKGKMKMYYVG